MNDEISPEPESTEEEISVEPDFPMMDPVPGFLSFPEGPLRDEARRAWLVPYLVSAEGILSPKYAEELLVLDHIVKTGESPKGKPGLTTVPGGKKGSTE